jgi:hypothetical protein
MKWRRRRGHTFARLSGLMGLTMSSVAGDRISLMLSSLTWFSCASSSICGGVSPAQLQCTIAASTSVWSVLQVPLLSTGEGSTVAGYGLGGARWSEVLEDLGDSISNAQADTSGRHNTGGPAPI